MEERMGSVTRTKTTEEWEAILVPAGVPASAINDVDALQKKHPEVFVRVDHPTAGSKYLSGAPFQFSAAPLDYGTPAPRLGEHTEEVLVRELGYSAEEVARLVEDGVVQVL